MKAEDHDQLDDLLSQWQIQTQTPSDFRREVWRRIATETCDPSWIERLACWLLRPKREVLVFAAVVIIAVAWGLTHPAEPPHPQDAYVMSISPFGPDHLKSSWP